MARIQHSIPEEVKEKAEWILKRQGITPAVATNLFYVEVINHSGLPFKPTPLNKIPSQLTLKTIQESKEGKNIIKVKNKEDLFRQLKE